MIKCFFTTFCGGSCRTIAVWILLEATVARLELHTDCTEYVGSSSSRRCPLLCYAGRPAVVAAVARLADEGEISSGRPAGHRERVTHEPGRHIY
jgi:hypothetical protein